MRIVRRVLCLGIVVVLMLVPATSAQDGTTDFEVPQMEDRDGVTADGQLDEAAWQGTTQDQIRLIGVDDEDLETFAQLYIAHNGSALLIGLSGNDVGGVTMQLDAGAGAGSFGPGTDGLRTDTAGGLVDLHWDRDTEQWVSDEEQEDCAVNGTVGTGSALELEKPFRGDDCDAFIAAGHTIAIRLVVEGSDGTTYSWPGGSVEDDVGGWSYVTLLDAFGDAGQPVGAEPIESPRDYDLETAERPWIDRGAPSAPGIEPEGPAYNADSEQDVPAPGWALLAVAGLAGLAVVAALRRT